MCFVPYSAGLVLVVPSEGVSEGNSLALPS